MTLVGSFFAAEGGSHKRDEVGVEYWCHDGETGTNDADAGLNRCPDSSVNVRD